MFNIKKNKETMKKEMYIAPSVEIVKVDMMMPLAASPDNVITEEGVDNAGSTGDKTGTGMSGNTGEYSGTGGFTIGAPRMDVWDD